MGKQQRDPGPVELFATDRQYNLSEVADWIGVGVDMLTDAAGRHELSVEWKGLHAYVTGEALQNWMLSARIPWQLTDAGRLEWAERPKRQALSKLLDKANMEAGDYDQMLDLAEQLRMSLDAAKAQHASGTLA